MLDVLIIHYNTPELTAAAIQSLWKHTPQARVTVFDNSDKRPFGPIQDERCTVIDNTRGQVVNFEWWLAMFPDKMPCPENDYGSAKHCFSVEMCYDLFPDGFVLMDSDVLLKRDITPLCDKSRAFVGRIHCNTRRLGIRVNRLCPWLCWINTPLLNPLGVRYYNKDKMWKLHPLPAGGYDTGAWFLEAALETGLPYSNIEITDYIEHFRAASWRKPNGHIEWLNERRRLWA